VPIFGYVVEMCPVVNFTFQRVENYESAKMMQKAREAQLRVYASVSWRNYKLRIDVTPDLVLVYDMARKFSDPYLGFPGEVRLPHFVLYDNLFHGMLSVCDKSLIDCFA
jgi:hypothetical protein